MALTASQGWALAFGSALVLIPLAAGLSANKKREKKPLTKATSRKKTEPPPRRYTFTKIPSGSDDEDPYKAKPTADDDDCLILGNDHPHYKFGKYRVCLSENQKQTLFHNERRDKLGCGVFACAYGTSSPDKVVKFTRDSEDVAALLEAQKTGLVPKVYATYKLRDGGHAIKNDEETPVYALVVERLNPIPPSERRALDDEISGTIGRVIKGRESVDEFCSFSSGIACDTAKAAVSLKKAGIDWSDIHSGNIGLDNDGKVKILDLGVTGTQLKEQPQILAGARRRLAKRALGSV